MSVLAGDGLINKTDWAMNAFHTGKKQQFSLQSNISQSKGKESSKCNLIQKQPQSRTTCC
jgi:hypothetical protein